MITGAHIVINSTNAEADRRFFREVLKYPNVDAGGGWLIFKLPPAEVAVHPAQEDGTQELYFLCDDLAGTMAALDAHGCSCSPVNELPWGSLTYLTLPGGGKLGLYQAKHPRAIDL